jgi:hypothetical protein
MYKIIAIKYEQPNFYRVRVKINENESIFLKFNHEPSIQEIEQAVNSYINHTINHEESLL